MEKRMPPISIESPHLEPHSDDQAELSSSFASQAHTIATSLVPSMMEIDQEAPKTGDEGLPSKNGAASLPPIPHGPKVSKVVIFMRRLYRPLHFDKGYNFLFCKIFLSSSNHGTDCAQS